MGAKTREQHPPIHSILITHYLGSRTSPVTSKYKITPDSLRVKDKTRFGSGFSVVDDTGFEPVASTMRM